MKRKLDLRTMSRGARRAVLNWHDRWWPGVRPLAIGATVSAFLVMAFWVIADEVVADRRDRFDRSVSLTVHDWSSPLSKGPQAVGSAGTIGTTSTAARTGAARMEVGSRR